MSKTFHVTAPDGHVIEVTGPDDATEDQAKEQAKRQYTPLPSNPSDVIPKVKPPVPSGLQGPAPSRLSQAATNLPYSVVKNLGNLAQGPQMGGDVNRDSQGHIDLNSGLHPLIDSVKKMSFDPLIDAAIGDPVGAVQTVEGLRKGGAETHLPRAASAVGQGLKVAAPDVISGGSQVVGGEVLAKVPGMEWPARFGLGYPGARQIASGIRKGFGATREAFSKSGENPVAPINETDIPGGQNPTAIGNLKKQLNKFSRGEEGTVNIDEMNKLYQKLAEGSVISSLSQKEGPIVKPMLPSGRVPGKPAEMPVGAPGTPQVQPFGEARTLQAEVPETQPNAPERQQTAIEKPVSKDENIVKEPSNIKPRVTMNGNDFQVTYRANDLAGVLGKPLAHTVHIVLDKSGKMVQSMIKGDSDEIMGHLDTLATDARERLIKTGQIKKLSGESEPQKPRIPDSGLTPKGGNVEPGGRPTEVATEVIKPGTGAPGDFNGPEPDQWTWESLKDQHGQAAVDRVKAKYSDLSTRLKSADISLEKFLALPQDAKDAIVKIPKHATQTNRSKYSNGYNPKYENLFKEIHGKTE